MLMWKDFKHILKRRARCPNNLVCSLLPQGIGGGKGKVHSHLSLGKGGVLKNTQETDHEHQDPWGVGLQASRQCLLAIELSHQSREYFYVNRHFNIKIR